VAHFQAGGLFWVTCTTMAILASLLLRETGAATKREVAGQVRVA
jgi:hypothetical protein